MNEIQLTEHPYVVLQGSFKIPVVRGTRVSVNLVANYYRRNAAIEEIERNHPELSPAAIHDAISYYLDHQKEIDSGTVAALIKESQQIEERNDAERTWVSGAALQERMKNRGVMVG